MTVSTSYAPLSYSGNGSTTVFSVTWPFFSATDIIVIVVDADGVETAMTMITHYAISGGMTVDGLPATGSVTMVTAPASGETLRIHRATNKVQSSTWTNGGSFQAKTIEATADRLMMIAQEVGVSGGSGGGGGDPIAGDALLFESEGADPNYFDARGEIIRNVADPVDDTDATNKAYVDQNLDAILAAAAATEASSSSASTSATSAASSATNASASAAAAASAKTAAEAAYDSFDDRYLGAKSSDPLIDNDGDALVDGVMYWSSTLHQMRVYDAGNGQFTNILDDHGELTGLGDDDHPQYHTDARGDARYPRLGQLMQWLGDTLAGIVPWRYVPPTTDPTAPKFNFSVTSGQWNNGPPGEPNYWDHTASLGWNFIAGTREDPSQAAFGLTFESKFYQGVFGQEFHLQQVDSAGVFHRQLSFFLPTAGGVGSSGGFQTDTVYLHNDSGQERVTWSLAGASPVMHLLSNVQIWSGTNNNAVMRQLNAAGNAYLALPYYNNENRLIIEGPARIVAAIAPGKYTGVEAIITSASANDALFSIAGPAITGSLSGFQCQAPVTDDFQSVHTNTGTGSATIIARVSAGSVQDPRVRFERNGVAYWTAGIDTSDANSFKIGGYTLDTDTRLRLDASAAAWNVPVRLPSYTVATVPSAAAAGAGAQIYVSNASGGPTLACSDGTNWRVVAALGAVVS